MIYIKTVLKRSCKRRGTDSSRLNVPTVICYALRSVIADIYILC